MKWLTTYFRENNFLLLFIVLMIDVSCSKTPGTTTSKLKIFSGNFQALLTSKANNGLIFYGKSSDGKTFTKKIDSDTADLVFPNGTWNFYAISWELPVGQTGALPNFTGKTYCGKSSAVFSGAAATIQIDLTNAGCNDANFSSNTKFNSTISPGIYELPSASFFTCKNISSVSGSLNSSVCDQTLTAKFNKGYATSYRVVANEYKNFGDATPPVKIAQSTCAETHPDYSGGLSAPFEIRVPTNFGNGFSLQVEIFYGQACDGSTNGVDVIPFNDNPRLTY